MSTRGCSALRSAALGAAFIGMAHDKFSQVAAEERGGVGGGGGITVVANSLKSINAYWKRNPDGEQLLRWFGLDRFFIYLFFCSAQPSYGRERRREISNLPQMEPLCPVTDELFRRVLKTKADW